jgi:hypothetical protein
MEQEPNRENEQTLAEILEILNRSEEEGHRLVLSVERLSEPGIFDENEAIVEKIDGEFVTIEASGCGFDIQIAKIKKAEIIEKQEEK